MKRPRATLRCIADRYHAPGERIIEFHSDKLGLGGLISLFEMPDGRLRVEVYRHDMGVYVLGPSEHFAALSKEQPT